MFGWEFPPHIAGGLGTACYGMTRGLARNGVEVTFVMPRAFGDEDQRFARVVNASDVETLAGSAQSGAEDLWSKMSFIHIDSNMVPYVSPEEYAEYHEKYVRTGQRVWEHGDVWKRRYVFSGKYGDVNASPPLTVQPSNIYPVFSGGVGITPNSAMASPALPDSSVKHVSPS